MTVKLRVGNRRLRPGLKLIAAYPKLVSVSDSKSSAVWVRGADVIDQIFSTSVCTVSPDVFPNDGSNFRKSQVITFCSVFGLSNPAPVLREVWGRLDTIVTERNGVAHGRLTPEEMGRNYTENDMNQLIDLWQLRWTDFLNWVEASAATRDFFRLPR